MSYRLVNNVDLSKFPSPLPSTFNKVDVVNNAPIKTGVPLKLVDEKRNLLIKSEMEGVKVSNGTLGPIPLALLVNNSDNEPNPIIAPTTSNSFLLPNAPTVDERGTPISQPFNLKAGKRIDIDNDRDGDGVNDLDKLKNKNSSINSKINSNCPTVENFNEEFIGKLKIPKFRGIGNRSRSPPPRSPSPAPNQKASIFEHCDYKGYRVDLPVGRHNLGRGAASRVKNDDISSVKPNGLVVTLHEHSRGKGKKIVFTRPDKCLVDNGWNDKTSSIEVSYPVSVFQHCNYKGYKVGLPLGKYTKDKLEKMGVRNNDLSSLKTHQNCWVSLFSKDNFKGKRFIIKGPSKCFVDLKVDINRDGSKWDWNDKVSSIIVSDGNTIGPYKQTASLYQHCDYKGYEINLPEGEYNLAKLRSLGMKNDDISSLRTNGLNVVLYEHDNFEGKRLFFLGDSDNCFTNNITEKLNWNDNTSSVMVLSNKKYLEFIRKEKELAKRKEKEAQEAERKQKEEEERKRDELRRAKEAAEKAKREKEEAERREREAIARRDRESAEKAKREKEEAQRREREAVEKIKRGHTVLEPTDWECVGNYGAPMKIGRDGEVHCMSGNDKDCMWSGRCQAKLQNPVNDKSFSCGAEHNEQWNSTGYDNSRHWCSVSKKHFEDNQESVHLYEGKNYEGKRVNLPVGEYDRNMLKKLGINNTISSIKTNNLVLRMFSRKLGKGKKLFLTEDDTDLSDNKRGKTKKGRILDWDDRTSSVKVMTKATFNKIMKEKEARAAEKQRELAEKAVKEAEDRERKEAEEATHREKEALKAMDGEWVRGASGNKKIISPDELKDSVKNCKLCSIVNRNGCSMENITDEKGDTRRVKTCAVKCPNPKPDCAFVKNAKPGVNCCDRLSAMQGKCCSKDYAGHCTRCGKKVTLDEAFIAETFQSYDDEIEGFGGTEIGIAIFIIALIIAVIVYLKKTGKM